MMNAPVSSLVYPIAGPADGELVEVAPGVRWARIPMPMRPDHVNAWILDDATGWSAIDTGTQTPECMAAWERLMGADRLGCPPRRIFATHMHPDHAGLAGWLAGLGGGDLWMTRLEYLSARLNQADRGQPLGAQQRAFYEAAGWSEAAWEQLVERGGRSMGRLLGDLPERFTRMVDGQAISIGGNQWEVVVGNGHSPEHACFLCPERKLFVSGDQVLPRISSNVSVHAVEPLADPMADWLASLDRIEKRVPDDVLVLPAHHDCFFGLHARVRKLRSDQFTSLDRLLEALKQPSRVVDILLPVFGREIGELEFAYALATGEALACLNYLVGRGEVEADRSGPVTLYKRH